MINKKAQMDEMLKIILWIVFFIVLAGGVYYLIKFLTTA